MLLTVAFWVAFTGLMALMQGLLLPTLRRSRTGHEAIIHDFALHKIGFVVWLLPVVIYWDWQVLLLALLIRFVLFDACVNAASGKQLFYVGQTAKTDRILRKIAGFYSGSPSVLSAVLKGIALCVLVWIIWREMLINN